jgi:hypothetical protein
MFLAWAEFLFVVWSDTFCPQIDDEEASPDNVNQRGDGASPSRSGVDESLP